MMIMVIGSSYSYDDDYIEFREKGYGEEEVVVGAAHHPQLPPNTARTYSKKDPTLSPNRQSHKHQIQKR